MSIRKTGHSVAHNRDGTFETVHDAWLASLRSDSPEILFGEAGGGRKGGKKAKRPSVVSSGSRSLSENALETFSRQIAEWKRPLQIASGSTFRTCFRLEEPENEKHEKWYVQYLLQASDDPSLIVPARQVWQGTGKIAGFLHRKFDNPQERLLSALGRAAGIFAPIEESLETAMPDGVYLDSSEAYRFLTEAAWILEQNGFGIILPAWWSKNGTGQKFHIRAKIKTPKMKGSAGLGLSDLMSFNWEAAIGAEKLSLQELRHLAKLKSHLVKVRGQWVELNTEELRAAIDLLQQNKNSKASLSEIIRMASGYTGNIKGVTFEGVIAEGYVADILGKLSGQQQIEILETPGGFSGTLRPYQQRGYSWLNFLKGLGLGACLADDMGLGKTIQTLALFLKDKLEGQKMPVLLICPTSVVGNWQREAARFAHELRVLAHHGGERIKGEKFKKQVKGYDVVISSYALVYRDAEFLARVLWAGIVLDEAQNVKNPETKQSKAVRSLKAGYRIALTGTPVENNIGDFWAIMEFLNPGFLGSQANFKRDFFLPIQISRDKEAISRLKHITKPFVLRRVKTDKSIISDLPEKMEMKVFVNLTKEQASLYQAVVNDVEGELDAVSGIQRKGLILATLAKLKQVCNHPAHFLKDNSAIHGRSGKLTRLKEMLEEVISEGDKTLIFTQYTEMGELIRRYLQEVFAVEVPFLHGGVTKKKRDSMVEQFQSENGRAPIFLLSLKAGGTGLNLTAANHVFHFDRWWNPSVENQATDRAFRIGQKKNVQVHKFICQGTLEEKIDEILERKKEIAEGVVGVGEDWITELSTDQLRELFALREDAVVL
ncbi:MAG: DEAD/DEAH box helicase [wastewater metagenome]|nr:DEAD/DEAH box helicase [Candidatus Loosdrechtia aerotolerans]